MDYRNRDPSRRDYRAAAFHRPRDGRGDRRDRLVATLGALLVSGDRGLVLLGVLTGAGAVVVSSAPPYSTIVGIPGKVIEGESTRQDVAGLDHVHLPDPVARAMQSLVDKINRIGVNLDVVCPVSRVLPARQPSGGS